MASDGELAAPIAGAEMNKWKIVSPYRIYFRHAMNCAIPVTVTYSFLGGYAAARKQFPAPKHVPPQLAWKESICVMKKAAAPIIGTLAIFNMARGHYEQNHFAKSQFDFRPLAYGLAIAGIPFLVTVAMRKPNVFLGASLGFCVLDYTVDRYSVAPVNAASWTR